MKKTLILAITVSIMTLAGCSNVQKQENKNENFTVKDCKGRNQILVNIQEDFKSKDKNKGYIVNVKQKASLKNMHQSKMTTYLKEIKCTDNLLSDGESIKSTCTNVVSDVVEGFFFKVSNNKYKLEYRNLVSLNDIGKGIMSPTIRTFETEGEIPETTEGKRTLSGVVFPEGTSFLMTNLVFCKK